uniref:Protein kinase domain-containing protein n=1 Tax=Nothobranchius furzeri TaxID=105023 RepID=A0A8C6LP90_NOTFU
MDQNLTGYSFRIAECRNVRTGEHFAMKIMKNKFYSQNLREAKILTQLKNLNLHESNIVNFSECFSYKDRTCFVYEKLEKTLSELIFAANGTPFHLSEIRGIAYQTLVALNSLNNSGFTHANIKPENIMCTDGISQDSGVKLIGFSNSAKTSDLCDLEIPVACGYTAPEVLLDGPLDESLDIWSLGCTLAFLFLGQHMSPVDCEYQFMRFIVNQGSVYISTTVHNDLTSLDDLFKQNQNEPMDYLDTEAFIDLLKNMLKVNPADRIKPADALNHPFITMSHLRFTPSKLYKTLSQKIMADCNYTKQQNVNTSLSTPTSDREITPGLHFSRIGAFRSKSA